MAGNDRSKNITQGVNRSPNRSMYYAMGYKKEDFSKPMIGIANGHSTITPCNSGLQKLADAAIEATKAAGITTSRASTSLSTCTRKKDTTGIRTDIT